MSQEAALMCPNAVERDGVLYLVGLREGAYRVRRSSDGGKTWLPFSDGEVEKEIAPASCEQRAGLVKLIGQGRPLLVCVPGEGKLEMYVSYDDGESWEKESEL